MVYSKVFVVLMGMGTVFFGLICIIVLTMLMGKIMSGMKDAQPAKKNETIQEVKRIAEAHPQTSDAISPEIIAVILAALSDDPGISSRGFNVTSIKKSI